MKNEISEVVHFEIPARDPEKLRKFYTGVFGWKFKNTAAKNMQYWSINTGTKHSPGVTGGMYKQGSQNQTPVVDVRPPDIHGQRRNVTCLFDARWATLQLHDFGLYDLLSVAVEPLV